MDGVLPRGGHVDRGAVRVGLRSRRCFGGGHRGARPAASRRDRVAVRGVGCGPVPAPPRGHGRVRRDRGQSAADRDRVGIGCACRRGVCARRGEQCRRHPLSVGTTRVGASRREDTAGAGGDERDGGNARRARHLRGTGGCGTAVAPSGTVGRCRRSRGRGGQPAASRSRASRSMSILRRRYDACRTVRSRP